MAKATLMFPVAIVTALILSQSVSAAALMSVIEDRVGDAFFFSGNPAPPYLDVVRAAITLKGHQFTFVMDLAASMPDAPTLPAGVVRLAWVWNLNTDPATFPAGFPFVPADAIPPEFQVWLLRDGTSFSGFVVDRRPLLTGGEAIITSVSLSLKSAEVTWSVDAALLDNPSSFPWKIRTMVWFGPFGSNGVQHVEAAPDDPGFAFWPS